MPIKIADLHAKRRSTVTVDLVMADGSREPITLRYEPDRFSWGLSQQLADEQGDNGQKAVDLLSQLIVEWNIDGEITAKNVELLGLPIQVALANAIEKDMARFRIGDEGKASSGG